MSDELIRLTRDGDEVTLELAATSMPDPDGFAVMRLREDGVESSYQIIRVTKQGERLTLTGQLLRDPGHLRA